MYIAIIALIVALVIYETYCFIRICDRLDALEEEIDKLRNDP